MNPGVMRLPILLVVSWTGKNKFCPSLFAPENLVSRDGFGSPVPRQPAHLHTLAESDAYLRDSSRVPRRCMYVCIFVCMVTHTAIVWINRVRLPILHVVSSTRKMNISLSAFAPEVLVSRDGFGSPIPRQPTHLHTQAEPGAYLQDSPRVPYSVLVADPKL